MEQKNQVSAISLLLLVGQVLACYPTEVGASSVGIEYGTIQTKEFPGFTESEIVMSTDSPPDGWVLNSGTWGTEVKEDTTFSLVGRYGLVFDGDPTDAVLTSDWISVGEHSTDIPRDAIAFWIAYNYAGSASFPVGINATVEFKFYTATKSAVSTVTHTIDPISGSGTWEQQGQIVRVPSTAKWLQVVVTSSDSSLLYIDSIGLNFLNPYYEGTKDSTLLLNGTWQAVSWTSTATTRNAIQSEIVRETGIYAINAAMALDDIDDGDVFLARVSVTPRGGGSRIEAYGQVFAPGASLTAAAAGVGLPFTVTAIIPLAAWETVFIEVKQFAGSYKTIQVDESHIHIAKL